MPSFKNGSRVCFQLAPLAALTLLLAGTAQAQTRPAGLTASNGAPGRAYHPSRVLVRFRGAPAFLPGSGQSHGLGNNGVFVVNNPPGLSVAEAIGRYRANPGVLYAEPDYAVSTTATPTDPLWTQQWDMQKISAPAAWTLDTSTSDVIVAVIDTGVDFTHPDLIGNLWTNPADGSHGFTCMNGTCSAGGQDDFGHGTHVAGTIGAVADNGIGIAGMNWHAQVLGCKFMGANGSGSTSDAVLCFNKILSLRQQGFNIRVTNNSWGGGGFSQTLKDAMAAVEAAGIVNVCAAGNSSVNADLAPMYPGGFDNRGIISVLASDANDAGASFTNYGLANVDIAAPGVNTLSTVPTGSCMLCDSTGYKLLSGTSMATPHVSAVLAAIFHLHPQLSAYQARDVVLNPASYDATTDALASLTSTGGRLNFVKAITNPLLTAPTLNNFPVLTGVSNVVAQGGSTLTLAATASDSDKDPLRMVWSSAVPDQSSQWLLGWMTNSIFPPPPNGPSFSFAAPALAQPALAPYAVSVADGRGGSATTLAYTTVLPSSAPVPPSGSLSVSPASGPVGTVVTVNYPVTDPKGNRVAWDLWQTGNGIFGRCCMTGGSFNVALNGAGVYRLSVQAIDSELNFSDRQSAVVRIGGATGTPPIARAVLDKTSGAAPLTVNIDMSGSSDPDGTVQSYLIYCDYANLGEAYATPKASCVYDTPGSYWLMLQVQDNSGLADAIPAYVVVTPATAGSKSTATVTLGKLTQTYTGGILTPTATTNPPGLAITWTNASQTQAGAYAVTATVNDANYQGSASGTFVIQKAAAPVTLGALTQAYTGAALKPSATTNPSGLAIAWTNAPQTQPGSYAVTATVNDANYQGSASGTFTITGAANGPAVSIVSPGNGAKVGSQVTIEAAVTAGGNSIAHVDFLVNGNVKCSDTAAPYTCAWKVPGAPNKTYSLQVKAVDTAGLTGQSNVITVTR